MTHSFNMTNELTAGVIIPSQNQVENAGLLLI